MLGWVGDVLVTLAIADRPIVIHIVDRVLLSEFAGIKHSFIGIELPAAGRMVVVVVNLPAFEFRHFFSIVFGEVGQSSISKM